MQGESTRHGRLGVPGVLKCLPQGALFFTQKNVGVQLPYSAVLQILEG